MAGAKYDPFSANLERLFARLFVAGGGLFWIAASFFSVYGLDKVSPLVSARNALLPLALSVIVLAVGWFYEYIAAGLLAVAEVGIVIWGFTQGWESGVWVLLAVTLLMPIGVAAVLYYLAARMETIRTAGDAQAAA
jgi:hypothetical protein